ncbi:hypothetical protein ABZU32_14875 [Sphaerisporangium sp. NPDC005288]|uniref:hypothetical protein n=1 Tax=Sphaerisporangium sp. NPDC005288 TaxID=3155114 RepID=UPI0033A9C6BB
MTSSPVRRGRRRRRPILVPAVVLLAAAGLGATAALGGLREAPAEQPPQRGAGEEVDQHLFRTKIENAVVRSAPTGSDDPGAPKERVLELSLRVYNNARNSVPLEALDESLLLIAPPEGDPLKSPQGGRDVGKWRFGDSIPGEGLPGRTLPPKRTSLVVMRFHSNVGADERPPAFPGSLTVELGRYENHEDAFTGRHRTQLVTGDDLKPVVAARVTIPVREEA